jgi:hypothetical protein
MAMNDSPMGAMADDDQMPPTDQGTSQQQDDEPVSVFLSKASLPAGKKFTKGDKITLTVEDVDPENGDVQACIYEDGHDNNHEYGDEMPSMKGFDAAMGPEKE